jgi:hypothetical protein
MKPIEKADVRRAAIGCCALFVYTTTPHPLAAWVFYYWTYAAMVAVYFVLNAMV